MRFNGRLTSACLWALLVLAALFTVAQWLAGHRPDADLIALLPQSETSSYEEQWLRRSLSDRHKDTVTVAVSITGHRAESAQKASAIMNQWLNTHPAFRPADETLPDGKTLQTLKALALSQLTDKDYRFLNGASKEALFQRAAAKAAAPFNPSALSFADDPFGVGDAWLADRLSQYNVRLENGVLLTDHGSKTYALFFLRVDNRSVMSQSAAIADSLSLLKENFRNALSDSEVIIAGLPIFSLAAAAQAQNELTVIGSLSALAIIAIAWFWFANLRALMLIIAVSAQAFILAVAATVTALGQIHLITLVFGTTLIGITVDYSAHFLCARLGKTEPPRETLRRLIPSLTLALISTALGFSLMAITPFPGLTQIALFCVTGVVSAYCAVVLWLPLLVKTEMPFREKLQRLARRLEGIPSLGSLSRKARMTALAAAGLFLIIGLTRVDLNTSVYDLNRPDPALLKEAGALTAILNTPSISQYFVIKADNVDELLIKEEQLEKRFAALKLVGVSLSGASDWIPSNEKSSEINKLKTSSCQKVNPLFESWLGAPLHCGNGNDGFSAEAAYGALTNLGVITPSLKSNDKISALVLINGLNRENLPAVRSLAEPEQNIFWRDYPEEISSVLKVYCERVLWLLAASVLGTVIILTIRFKREAWRAYLPCITGIALTIASFGWMGQSLTLFSLLACVLLLGLGLDYGIFLTSAPQSNLRTVAAITFAVLTTLLSFGLLAFSKTPALSGFGLCVMIGEFFIWCLTPAFRKDFSHEKQTS